MHKSLSYRKVEAVQSLIKQGAPLGVRKSQQDSAVMEGPHHGKGGSKGRDDEDKVIVDEKAEPHRLWQPSLTYLACKWT